MTTSREITATANQSARTFTIRISYPDGTKMKYRTIQLDKNEFNSCEYNTESDWNEFLKSSDYYKI